MTEVPFAITFDIASRTLMVAGDVDEHNTAPLREGIEKHSQMYSVGMVLDLSAVTYLPSAAVGVLVRADQEFAAAGTPFELAAAGGTIAERVLTVCAMPHRAY